MYAVVQWRKISLRYGNAFTAACKAVSKTIEIVRSPGYKDRSSWKADCSNEHSIVYYKDIDGLRYFSSKTKISLPAHILVNVHWNEIEKVKDYNDNIKHSRSLTKLTENIDVANYASNEKFMVKSREFLVSRMRISYGNGYILAGRSCEIDSFTSSKDAVRAFAHVAAGWYYPDPEEPDSSIYDYLVSMDLKGMLVKSVANQALGKMVLSEMENNRLHALELSSQLNH